MKPLKIFAAILFLLGMFFVLNSTATITGAVIGLSEYTTNMSVIFGMALIFGSVMMFANNKNLENLVSYVIGKNPSTKELSRSPLYSKVDSHNIKEIFQTPLEHKFGKNIKGAKAIVYCSADGSYHTAFLTETVNTHHRHAAATVARLVEGVNFNDPSYLDKKADALYEGNSARSCELLTQCAGYQLQYDTEKNSIVGIQHDSWITNEQQRCGRKLSGVMEEDMMLELLSNIDEKYLIKGLKNLDDKYLSKLYSEKNT